MIRECIVCSTPIKCYPSTFDKKKYCSTECRIKATHIFTNCIYCGKEYSVAKSLYNNGKNIRHKCCSESCRDKYHKDFKNKRLTLCLCCGKIIKRRESKTGLLFCSQQCSRKYMRGINSPFYKGGTISSNGYKIIKIDGKYRFEHRLKMEKYLGRKLLNSEDVHHIDGDKLNNRIDNLLVISKSDHARLHGEIKRQREA